MIRLAVRVRRADAADALAELLAFSPAGVEEVDDGGESLEYVLYGAPGELPALPALRASVGGALVDLATSEIEDDWSTRWRSFHHPVAIGAVLRVRAPWHDAALPGGPVDLVIEPGQAFGTGAHATTRACLELLVELAATGEAKGPLVDLGTGSGVLAIAAATLGFSPIIAVDHELASVEAARFNARANGVDIDVRHLDLLTDTLPPVPTMTANLLRPLLLALASLLARPPRLLIASGLLRGQADEVADAFVERLAMRERARRTIGDWTALMLEAAVPPRGSGAPSAGCAGLRGLLAA